MLQNAHKCSKILQKASKCFKRLQNAPKVHFQFPNSKMKNLRVQLTSINARSWNFKVKMRLGRPWPSFFVAYKVRMVCAYFQKNFFFALLPFLLPINFFSVKLLFRKEENRFTKLKKVTSSKTEIFKC